MAQPTPEEVAAFRARNPIVPVNRTAAQRVASRQPATPQGNSSAATPAATAAPAKADAAPNGNTTKVFTGLCDALNEFQRGLVRPGGYQIADEYEIQFAPPTISAAKVALQGTAYKATPTTQEKKPGAALNPETQRMDVTGRVIPVTAGIQIVQFIDQVMRSSSYITDQANFIINETTQKLEPKPGAAADAEVTWYKVNFQAENLGWDDGRNDYAYKMIYTIAPYAINRMDSQYFPEGRYRGVHKSYNYWFTGKNNAIINFEQEYNNMYTTILSGTVGGVGKGGTVPVGLNNTPPSSETLGNTNSKSTTPKSYAPAASVSNQGADSGANEIGASAADFLYSLVPQGEVKMRIIGDPGWIAQGEVTNTINAATMTFAPFLPDGTINMDAGEVMFDVYFNRPGDYNFDTGVVNVNGKTVNPNGTTAALQPQAHLTYVATNIKSFFNDGKFEQEITGKIYNDQFAQTSEKIQKQTAEREATANTAGTRTSAIKSSNTTGPAVNTSNNTAPAGDINNRATQPAAPAGAVTSNGDVTSGSSRTVGGLTFTNDFENSGGFNPGQAAASRPANVDIVTGQVRELPDASKISGQVMTAKEA